jgi:hypothetical protein
MDVKEKMDRMKNGAPAIRVELGHPGTDKDVETIFKFAEELGIDTTDIPTRAYDKGLEFRNHSDYPNNLLDGILTSALEHRYNIKPEDNRMFFKIKGNQNATNQPNKS